MATFSSRKLLEFLPGQHPSAGRRIDRGVGQRRPVRRRRQRQARLSCGRNYPTPALARLELPVESFVAFLRAAPNDMPAYSANVLSDQDATDIYAFLQSLPGRKPAKDFPLLNQ
jgi:hypothetical protein